MRYPTLDGLRGLFLCGMTLGHASYLLQSNLVLYSYHSLGYADALQGFVFVSGLVAGLVYLRRADTQSPAEVRRTVHARAGKLFLYHVLMVTAVMALAAVPIAAATVLMRDIAAGPLLVTWATSSLMLTQIPYFDILPIYVVFLLVAPLALEALRRGRWALVAQVSVALWILAQTEIASKAAGLLPQVTALPGGVLQYGPTFDVLAYQLLFFGGMILAAFVRDEDRPIAWLRHPRMRTTVRIACALSLVFVVVRMLDTTLGLMDTPSDKPVLGPVVLGNFVAWVILIAWTLTVGVEADRPTVLRHAAGLLRALVTAAPFRLLGRHSLQVYVWHCLSLYAAVVLFDGRDLSASGVNLVVVALIAVLFVPALIQERRAGLVASAPGRG